MGGRGRGDLERDIEKEREIYSEGREGEGREGKKRQAERGREM